MLHNQIIALCFFLVFVLFMPKSIDGDLQSRTFASVSPQFATRSFRSTSQVVENCLSKLGGKTAGKCVDEEKKFLCNTKPLTHLSLGKVKYCLSARNHQLTLEVDLRTAYDLSTNSLTYRQLDARVELGLSEMIKLYNQYGIDLAVTLTRVPLGSKDIDFIVQDSMNTGSHMFRFAPIYRGVELSDPEFALLFSHEVSHHLGLPDRSQSDSCPLRVVSDDSLMGHMPTSGSNGMKLSEDDLKLLLAPLCDTPPPTRTLKSYFLGRSRGSR